MKGFRAPAIVVVVSLALAALVAGTASAKTRTWAFSGTFAGTVTEKVDGQLVTATTKGKGKVTLIGMSTVSGVVKATTTADQPCAPFGGPGTIASPKTTLKVVVVPTSRGCAASEEDRNNISVSGSVKVSGGTKVYKAAKGTLRFTGKYDRSSGAFTVKLTGKLTY
jgi:hypothetical protein